MYYLTIYFLILGLVFYKVFNSKKNSPKISLFVITIVLILFAGLRNQVGTDWNAYYNFYIYGAERLEIGYSFINNLFRSLSLPYNFFLIVLNTISLIFIFLFLKRNSYIPLVGILLFYSDLFLYYNFSGIRQAIAISITCFSINFAIDKKFIKFLISVLFASSFHITAIVFLIVFFISKEKLSLKVLIIFSLSLMIGLVFLNSMTEVITLYTAKDANFYLNLQEKSNTLQQDYIIGILRRSLVLLMLLFFYKKVAQTPNFRYFFHLYILGIIIFIATYKMSPDIGTRLSSYFTIFELVLAGNLIFSLRYLWNKIIVTCIVAFIGLYKILGYASFDTYIYKSIF